MNRTYSGHVPVRVPTGWTDQNKAMVIQINSLFDDLYRKIATLQKEIDELREDDDNGTDNEPSSEET
jgi:hypothetical protein